MKTSKEFTKEEIGEIYNSLIHFKKFVQSLVNDYVEANQYEQAKSQIERAEKIEKLIEKVDRFGFD